MGAERGSGGREASADWMGGVESDCCLLDAMDGLLWTPWLGVGTASHRGVVPEGQPHCRARRRADGQLGSCVLRRTAACLLACVYEAARRGVGWRFFFFIYGRLVPLTGCRCAGDGAAVCCISE